MTARWKRLAAYWGIAHLCECKRLRAERETSKRLGDEATAEALKEAADWHAKAFLAHQLSLVGGAT